MLRIIYSLIFVLFVTQIKAQILLVTDEMDQPLPYFSLIIEDNNQIQIGDFEGKVLISNPKLHCNYTVRYLGYQSQKFCWDGQTKEIKIKLLPDFLDLPATQVKGFSDKEMIRLCKEHLRTMVEKFNLAKAFVKEETSLYTFETFGVVTLAGLKNRSAKNAEFDHGNMGFISQYSRLWVDSESLIPVMSKMSSVSTFTQDLLFEIINSKNLLWKLDESIMHGEEVFKIEQLGCKVHLNFDGSVKKIVTKDRLHKDSIGISFYYTGDLYFVMDNNHQFFSELKYNAFNEKESFKISCIILDVPKTIKLPQKYSDTSIRNSLMNAIGSYTHSPDYNYDPAVLKSLFKKVSSKYDQELKGNQKIYSESYKFHEVYKTNDKSSHSYLAQNSNFIQELIKTLKLYDLAW